MDPDRSGPLSFVALSNNWCRGIWLPIGDFKDRIYLAYFSYTPQSCIFHKLHFLEFLNTIQHLVSASSTHQDLWPHKGIMAIWCQVLLFYGLSLLPWNPENLSMCHSNQWKALESHQLNTNPDTAGKKCAKSKKFKRRTSRLIIIHFW